MPALLSSRRVSRRRRNLEDPTLNISATRGRHTHAHTHTHIYIYGKAHCGHGTPSGRRSPPAWWILARKNCSSTTCRWIWGRQKGAMGRDLTTASWICAVKKFEIRSRFVMKFHHTVDRGSGCELTLVSPRKTVHPGSGRPRKPAGG